MGLSDIQNSGGLLGWIDRNRGKLGILGGIGISYGIYKAKDRILAYFEKKLQNYAEKSAEYLADALKQKGIIGNPQQNGGINPEMIYKGLKDITETVGEIYDKMTDLEERVTALEKKNKRKRRRR